MTNNINQEKNGFYGLGIAPKFFEILDELNFTVPTPIQVKSIPVAIEGKDLVGIAQTGTGKTLAFGVPMLQRLAQIREILKAVPKKRQTMLFSATMPPEIMNIAAREMALPVRIEVAPAGTAAAGVTQEMIIVNVEDKFAQVEKILVKHTGPVLVFTRTKHGAKNLCRKLRQIGHKSAEIHSNRSLAQRREALDGFKIGKFRILVATDIAARGIDVSGIELVLNYDLPEQAEDYVHRIGRTARAGRTGVAISLAMPAQLAAIKKIEKTINKTIPQTRLAAFPAPGITSIFHRNHLKFSHHRQTRETGPRQA